LQCCVESVLCPVQSTRPVTEHVHQLCPLVQRPSQHESRLVYQEVLVKVLQGLSTAAVIGVGYACAAPAVRGIPEPCAKAAVPPEPPDTVPAWFQDDSSFSDSGPGTLKHIIVLRFQPGTPLADRQAAIHRACGEVVGGWTSEFPERRAYAVRVPDGGDENRLLEFAEDLRNLPQVRSAEPTVRRSPQ
jgi:hypothetical protein